MTNPDPRIEKIQKLLTMAERGVTEAERESFQAKANHLMVQWEIDEASLTAAGVARLKIEDIVTIRLQPEGPVTYGYEYSGIGGLVADALGMRGAHSKVWSQGRYRDALTVVGFESDVRRFELLFRSLERQCTTAMTQWAKTGLHSWMSGTQKFQARRGFITGFANMVAQRLTILRQSQLAEHTQTHGTGAALVLVTRKDRVEQHVISLGWGTARARSYDANGARAGRDAGARADIGQNRFGTAARGAVEA